MLAISCIVCKRIREKTKSLCMCSVHSCRRQLNVLLHDPALTFVAHICRFAMFAVLMNACMVI